jgi:hypothetical protein
VAAAESPGTCVAAFKEPRSIVYSQQLDAGHAAFGVMR